MPDNAPMPPEAVFREALTRLAKQDLDGWMALCAEDVVFEFPFAPSGRPRRLEGKAAVADYLSHLPGSVELSGPPALTVHHTTDPETIIVEMGVEGRVTATGRPYAQDYVIVLVVKDGLMTLYRDYWNPLVTLELEKSA